MNDNDDLADRVARLSDLVSIDDVIIAQLKKQTALRGARMQIMRDFVAASELWDQFSTINPGAKDWFDEDGAPK